MLNRLAGLASQQAQQQLPAPASRALPLCLDAVLGLGLQLQVQGIADRSAGSCPCAPALLSHLQAHNNWGLVLQDISGLRPPSERAAYLRHSLSKFRRAIRLRPDFDRACYNLGGLAGRDGRVIGC